jgi:hypothetical protein
LLNQVPLTTQSVGLGRPISNNCDVDTTRDHTGCLQTTALLGKLRVESGTLRLEERP